jgi:chromosome segregation ATPase
MKIHVNVHNFATALAAPSSQVPLFARAMIMLCLAAGALNSPITQAESSPDIQLPSLIQRWKIPGEEEKPTITIDEIVQCMGTDAGVRERQTEIKQQETALESEYVEITSRVPILEKQAAELKAGNEQIKKNLTKLKNESAKLKDRRNAIETTQKRKQLGPSEIKQLSADIAAYNADAQTNNRQQSLLQSSAVEFQKEVDTYNSALGKHNEQIAHFNEKNTRFKASANQLNAELLAYKNTCAGERTLKK